MYLFLTVSLYKKLIGIESWKLEVRSWKWEVGGWKMEVGSWTLLSVKIIYKYKNFKSIK